MQKMTLLLWFAFAATLVFLPTFSKAEQKSVVEVAREQREARKNFDAISEELKQNSIHVRCYSEEAIVSCVRFVTDIKNQAELQRNFQETLLGEVLTLSRIYQPKVCWILDGNLYADPQSGLAAVLSCLNSDFEQKSSKQNSDSDSDGKKVPPDELRELEKKFRAVADRISFSVGVDNTGNLSKYSSSAFVVAYNMNNKKTSFLITAGHVAGHFGVDASNIYVYRVKHKDKENIVISGKFKNSEILDIAAIMMPFVKSDISPGIPRTDALPTQMPIAALCNPLNFGISVRTGFISKMNETEQDISLEFPGIGVEDGCSGSPIIDEQGHILGLLVRGVPSGRVAYAIPIARVLKFVREEFK